MAKPELVLIGNWDWLLNNLVKPFIRGGFDLSVVVPPISRLTRGAYLKRVVEIPRFTEQTFIEYLAERPQVLDDVCGTYIWSSDSIMRLATNSAIPDSVKQRILPTANRSARQILGSKVGQVKFFSDSGVNYPRTLTLNSPLDRPIPVDWQPILVKGDQLGGGDYINEFSGFNKVDLNLIPDSWYPLTLQEKLQGRLISAEAFYQRGRLVCWMYSEMKPGNSEFGPSIARVYRNPSNLDFVDALKTLGERACLSGLVNVSFVLDFSSEKHHIFEFDARPNVWHHLWERFDLPLASAWIGEVPTPVHPTFEAPVTLYEPDRIFDQELAAGRILNSIRVLQGKELSQLGVPARSSFYDRDRLVRHCARVFIFPLLPFRTRLRKLVHATTAQLPIGWRERLRESRVAREIVKFFFGA